MAGNRISPTTRPPEPSWLVRALHLFALSGFAVAAPLFDTLSRNGAFFVARGTTTTGLVLFAVAVVMIPPAVMLTVVAIVALVSVRATRFVMAIFVGSLAALVVGRPLSNVLPDSHPYHNIIYLMIAVIAGITYVRLVVVRRFVTFLLPAPVVFVVMFLVFSPVSALFADVLPVAADGADSDTSVIFVLLDEGSLGSLLDPVGRIDAHRFPNVARLAGRSTWYPNATTNSNSTLYAMPTILTGKYPKGRTGRTNVLPIAQEYPNNLFALLQSTHGLDVDEWMTALCPLDGCRRRVRDRTSMKDLIGDTGLIYAHMSLPQTLRARLPDTGLAWGRYLADPLRVEEHVARLPRITQPLARPVFKLLADDQVGSFEARRLRSFIDRIRRTAEPTFRFLHVGLPHFPWHLVPGGRAYDDQVNHGLTPSGFWLDPTAADRTFQRYLLQLKATDELIGDLMSRMEDQGVWDETMLVMSTDHGVSFSQGKTLRTIVGAEDELLPIPLFVKYPGQARGAIDRRNAELIDLAPTIADVLSITLPWDTDGVSLLAEDLPDRPKRAWQYGRSLPPFSRIGHPTAIAQRIRTLFGGPRKKDDLFAWGPHRDLVGESPRRSQARSSVSASIERPSRYRSLDLDTAYIPARLSGTLTGTGYGRWIAILVNGRVAGLGRPFRDGTTERFSIMVSPRYFVDGENDIGIVGIVSDETLVRIPVEATR